MRLELDFLPGIHRLLGHHEQAGQQPDNLCGPYWISLLLQTFGAFSVSAVDVAKAASTLLPNHGHPSDWLPPGAASLTGEGYDTITTGPNIDECGTSVGGLIQATERLSQGRFCLLPLQTPSWELGLNRIVQVCDSCPDLQIIPLLNVHTSYFWCSRLTPVQVVQFLQAGQAPSVASDWRVGHFALLAGHLQSSSPKQSGQNQPGQNQPGQKLYAILDTYPQFGWNGLHLQPLTAIAQSLHRPRHATQGGIAVFVQSKNSAQVQTLMAQQGFHIAPWDNGTPFCPS